MWQTLSEILFAKIKYENSLSTLLLTIVKLPEQVQTHLPVIPNIYAVSNSAFFFFPKMTLLYCMEPVNHLFLLRTLKVFQLFSWRRMFPLLLHRPIAHAVIDSHAKFYTVLIKHIFKGLRSGKSVSKEHFDFFFWLIKKYQVLLYQHVTKELQIIVATW